MGDADIDVPGLDLDRLGVWFAANVDGATTDLAATVIAGGKSNLTYIVTSGDRQWIVRRPPLGHVLATAHDMAREHRVISALRDTPVPVPATYGMCADDAVIGAPFYVMERVAGTPYRRAAELEALGRDRTRTIAIRMVDTLAALHRVDPAAVGLADFGRPAGYLARQVTRWKQQLEASYSRDLPAADELHRRLAAAIPAESAIGIVHGDFRLDNLLVDDDDDVTAVLDWEMATLGDTLSDLALMLVYHRLGTLPGVGDVVSDVAVAPGFLSEREVIDHYGTLTGRDLAGFGWHLGLAAFKLTAILEGIHYRYLRGQTVGDGFDHVGDSIDELIATGLNALEETI